ncbi:hypothetical protein [Paenirhodobacter sp. CAU 1674]|uniref:hypothetical protein n=1 Tax=Paenirhodobacter sp. CAU 1674 TaxID=3032596 RepID=UPI0023DC4CC1|nr:hypothetical protein [Paenirhodobacter sp. CAU 1674]MDF2140830.1 hypothetical protein [Paenirhodobacter sp. CAU 1674]
MTCIDATQTIRNLLARLSAAHPSQRADMIRAEIIAHGGDATLWPTGDQTNLPMAIALHGISETGPTMDIAVCRWITAAFEATLRSRHTTMASAVLRSADASTADCARACHDIIAGARDHAEVMLATEILRAMRPDETARPGAP